jgi:glycosyltransferase A (GT-A) superfamily protein (DUF2064 family)
MAEAPRPGRSKARLEPLLGAEGCARLQRALVARTLRWAQATGAVFLAHPPEDAREGIEALAPAGATVFAQEGAHRGERLAAAFGRVAEEHAGPVAVVGTDQPGLAPAHAWAVADDLRDGVDVCLGPATDGAWYLLAAARPHPSLFGIDPAAWDGPDVMGLTLRSVHGAGLSMGWLRSERALDTPGDAAALLADPCAPADIRAALQRAS